MVTKRELAGVLQTVPIAAGLDGLARGDSARCRGNGFGQLGDRFGVKLGFCSMGHRPSLCMACLYLPQISVFLQEKGEAL